MNKIISILLVIISLFSLCSCSKEAKFGFGEFCKRMSDEYQIEINEANVSIEKDDGKNRLYCTLNSYLLVTYLGSNDNITGIAMLLTDESQSDIATFYSYFIKCTCVFTGLGFDDVQKTLLDCDISPDIIKFADSNKVYTVGKFKYSVITNEKSITLFCERV